MLTGPGPTVGAQAVVFGPYRIGELLGRGGMGVVHRAFDTVHERMVALKRLPERGIDAEYRARFRREARLAAGLRHPHAVRVHAFGEIDGQLYLDMALIEGVDLRRLLGDARELDPLRALHLLGQVAGALDAAHAAGLVHRDVKPSNILIAPGDHAYLADFGIARSMSSESTDLTASGQLLGSWDYLAPERLSGAQVDGRADQYSLACVLFECLAGRLPFPEEEPVAAIAAHLMRPPPAPSQFVPTIPPELDAVVLRGMAKEPARRFGGVGELVEAAQAALGVGTTRGIAGATASGPLPGHDRAYLVRAVLRSTGARPPVPAAAADGPYPGLRGFEQADAGWFHGRQRAVTDLLIRMTEQLDTPEPVVLVGASGSGKSSLLRAGLLPALATAADGSWPVVLCSPGPNPVATLAEALARVVGGDPAALAAEIRRAPAGFGRWCQPPGGAGRLLLVVDQLEELFTHDVPDADRLAFTTALVNAHPAVALLAVRADLVERCIELPALVPALRTPVLLGPLTDPELREVILAPARDAGVPVEPGLPDRLIADLGVRGERGYEPGALPRLAHVLRETWLHGDRTGMTLAGYRRAGGVEGAIARTAEQFYVGLDEVGAAAAREQLLRLVSVLDGVVARRRVPSAELIAVPGGAPVLSGLIAARLVTVDETGAQLSHEALLRAWPRLRDWVEADRTALARHEVLGEAARAWQDAGRQDDDLYRGARLAAVQDWLGAIGGRVRLHAVEQEFLDRSDAAERATGLAARRRTRRLRALVAALSVLLLVAGGAVVVASTQRQEAVAARQLALSRQLAAESGRLGNPDPRRSVLLALGAWQAAPTPEARSALLAADRGFYRGATTGSVNGSVTAVAVSGDGRLAATGGRDGTLRLWDVPSRREIGRLGPEGGWYRSVSMSADGRYLVAANPTTRTVTLWQVPERRLLFTEPAPAMDAAIAPDGSTFAVSVDASRVVVRDVATFTERADFANANLHRSVYSPDGTLIATTSGPDILLNRAADGTRVAKLSGHTDRVVSIAFDLSGARLVSGSADGTVRVWDVQSRRATKTLARPPQPVFAVEFTGGDEVLIGDAGGGVDLWDLGPDRSTGRIPSGDNGVESIGVGDGGRTVLGGGVSGQLTFWSVDRGSFGFTDRAISRFAVQPGGPLVATVTGHGEAAVWDRGSVDRPRTIGEPGAFTDVAFSPDGSRLATVNSFGTVALWDPVSGAQVAAVGDPSFTLSAVTFTADGSRVAVASRALFPAPGRPGSSVALLAVPDLTTVADYPTGDADPTRVAASPDGRQLAAPLSDGRVAVFGPDGTPPLLLPGHAKPASTAEFSPDGRTLATGGGDTRVRLWTMPDGQPAGEIDTGQHVRTLAFAPDGHSLVIAALVQQLRLWQLPDRQLLANLDRFDDAVNDLAFDRDGNLVVGLANGTVEISDLDPDRVVRSLCDRLDVATIDATWRNLGPDLGPAPSCPS